MSARAPHAAKLPPKIIVKKIIVEGGGGHHGGAWKVAYADLRDRDDGVLPADVAARRDQ
jgi:flagellar motor protein MotB